MKGLSWALLAALLPAAALAGAADDEEFFSLERATLEEMLNIKTSVSTLKEVPLQKTPGLVTVITAEEIRASGARDLIDVLNQVPDLEFGADGWGNLGLSVRGNWANEGKVLLLWDGQSYNEPLYTNVQYDRFPIDQIEQIEIIKGPGSVVYGGYAELAVIDVKTRSAKNLNGSAAYAAYGQARAKARSYAGYSFGRVFDGGTEVAAKLHWGEAQRSDRRYRDFAGNSYVMNGDSGMYPRSLNISAARGGLSLRFIADEYYMRSMDGYGDVLSSGTEKIAFDMLFAEARYDWKVSDALRLEPRLQYAGGKPWEENNHYYVYDKDTSRVTGALTAFYDPGPAVSLVAGGEYYRDTVDVGAGTSADYVYPDGSSGASYYNAAVFGQGVFDLGRYSLTAGGRYDGHSESGGAFSPRLAATGVWDRLSLKAIYSGSFRAPSLENLRINPSLDPEKTVSTELEAGYRLGEILYFSGSFFRIYIDKPILYYSDLTTETYNNYSRTGTQGFGLGARYKRGSLRAELNYLFHEAYANRVDSYKAPGRGSYMLGLPKHKATFAASVPAGPGLSVNPSAVYVSRRYAYDWPGSVRAFKDTVVASVNLLLRDRVAPGLALSLGVRDIFNSGYSYLQHYTSGHAPLPAQSREFFLKAAYEF